MKSTINCNGKLIDITKPIVMGILNITPDSFYDGGKYNTDKDILKRAEQILSEGGKIIDIGAYSSRPGAEHITEQEEIKRLITVLKIIKKEFSSAITSVDTFRASVANTVINDYEVAIINDISAGDADDKMFETIAKNNVPYIMMHMKGNPQTMQNSPKYDNLLKEIQLYFANKIQKAKLTGINDVIIDPGFGFGKTLEHNYQLLNSLDRFSIFDLPILVGISRKSMIYKLLNTNPKNSLNGTTALNMIALTKGAKILRVHDVKEAVQLTIINEQLLMSIE